MKWLTPFIILIALVVLGCNHEGPINVSGQDDNSTIQWKVDKTSKPDELQYTIYLPASWCPNTMIDSLSPWTIYFMNGYRSVHKINNSEIQSAEAGKENYYRQIFTLPRDQVLRVLLYYGNHRNGNDPDHASAASLKGRDNQFMIVYQPNQNRQDDFALLGFTLSDGQVGQMDNNLLVPIEAKIGVDLPVRAARDTRFTVNDLKYTDIIGVKSYVWEFSDGYKRYGTEVFKRFDKAGKTTVQLTVTDNLGKEIVITRNVDVTN